VRGDPRLPGQPGQGPGWRLAAALPIPQVGHQRSPVPPLSIVTALDLFFALSGVVRLFAARSICTILTGGRRLWLGTDRVLS
jgi:hypothetical protein